ncbi:MAG: hypothetical protein KJ558_16500 [Gammaproteobacteria bacterium]|nr:hypothetical protein [Gammaproteobacteria bacterium]MBU1656392.1 hypothetical protein [Gammaproteobacteria bacterium]MBU1960940.1 hypothetical protein [Gammaproteobacteria bacterium]
MSNSNSLEIPRWLMGQNPYVADDNIQYLIHQETPRFIARWCFGAPTPPPRDPAHLYVEDGEGDAVHVYDFQWIDTAPDATGFEEMMSDAVEAIDQWLENNMAPPARYFD